MRWKAAAQNSFIRVCLFVAVTVSMPITHPPSPTPPSACNFFRIFQDTFLDAQHIIDSFPQYDVTFVIPSDPNSSSSSSRTVSASSSGFDPTSLPPPPYKVTYPAQQQQLQPAPGSTKRGPDGEGSVGAAAAAAGEGDGGGGGKPVLLVEHYRPINMGPYPEDKPKDNAVRFTPVQVEAIGAGVQPGGVGEG